MDDLDHSIDISEYDWTVFWEESEDCDLLLPSLAIPDETCLSDTEDCERFSSQSCAKLHEFDLITLKSTHITEDESCTRSVISTVKECNSEVEEDNVKGGDGKHVTHVTEKRDSTTFTERTESVRTRAEEQPREEKAQTDGDPESTNDPLPNQTGLGGFETHAESAEREVLVKLPLREEKERWFVTVNDNLVPKPSGATYIKKKQGLKKNCCGARTLCRPRAQTPQEKEEERKTRKGNESKGGRRKHTNQEIHSTSEYDEVTHDASQSKENLVISDLSEDNSSTANRNTREPVSSISQPSIMCGPAQLERGESDELDDSAEFLSIHSYDSESYLSAAESVEEPQSEDSLPLHCLSFPSSDMGLLSVAADTDEHEGQTHSCDSSLLDNIKGFSSSGAAQSLTFPSSQEEPTEYPAGSSTCTDNMHSRTSQSHSTAPTASVCSEEPQCVPDVTITAASPADSLETYGGAAGSARPVYAISAFFDEMEKLTINDIKHLRTGRDRSSKKSPESLRQTAQDPPTDLGSVSDYGAFSFSDRAMTEASDTADSDYFTQTDESKPDCSSCEFSTSDFEEEYWQFSRESSPDTIKKNQQSKSPCLTREEEPTGSEGKEAPVPTEQSGGEGFDGQQCQKKCEPKHSRLLMKSKSMQNVLVLAEGSVPSASSLADDLSSLVMSRCHSVEETVLLEMNHILQTENCVSLTVDTDSLCSDDGMSFPPTSGYIFTEIDAKTQCVKVYNPQDISVSPACEWIIGTHRDEMPSFILQRLKETPVPIFSCSHPTVRDLTIAKPNSIFIHSGCKGVNDASPMRVVSHSFIHFDKHGHFDWKTLLLPQKVCFYNKGSPWWGSASVWAFPAEKKEASSVIVLNEQRVLPASSELFRELEGQHRMLETLQATKPEGIFSSLKQSDMCLVCIAFASWVLRSSDPEAADAWKAALLANVSALSAIQYLRRYVKRNPPQDDP